MRTMDIPPFSETRIFSDLLGLYKTRLSQRLDAHAPIAVPLLSYMAWPNDRAARENGVEILKRWVDNESLNFRLISEHWAHVADIMNLHYAMSRGLHEGSRGGTSVGKAIYLASQLIEVRGAKSPSLWRHWQTYKDVAHLIAATMAVCFDMQTRHRQMPIGIGLQELHPLTVVSLVPDLVIGVAMTYEKYGLSSTAKGGTDPMLDPETTWRIPANINVEPVDVPVRKIPRDEKIILNGRRAGNRGVAKRYKTTLISA